MKNPIGIILHPFFVVVSWVLWKLGYLEKKGECQHKRFTRKQWFDADGTPMVYFNYFGDFIYRQQDIR